MKNLPAITRKQLEILLLIYKFRFLDTKHFQTILGHKNPRRVQEWLKDLVEKKCLARIYERKIFGENTKPAVYYLASNGRLILKDNKDCDIQELDKVYKEKKRSKKFIDHSLSLADIYLFFLAQKDPNEELHFFTRSTLGKFDHFPDPRPDAYIAVKDTEKTKRYFMDCFDDYTPSFIMRKRVKYYLAYTESGSWEAKTESPLPPIFLIFPNEKAKSHIYWYCKSLLDKSFNDKALFYLATKSKILSTPRSGDIWQKVI